MSGFMLTETFIFILFTLFSSYSAKSLQDPFDVFSDFDENPELEHCNISAEEQVLPNCTTYLTSLSFTILSNGNLYLKNHNQTARDKFYLKNGTAYFCDKDVALTTTFYNLSEILIQTITTSFYNFSKDVTETITASSNNFSEEFQRCAQVQIEPEEYKLLKKGTIYIEIYSKSCGPLDCLIVDSGVCVCVPSFEQNGSLPYDWEKFSETSDYVTFTGLLVSVVSLISHLGRFLLVPVIRNLPLFCLASLSLSLIMAYKHNNSKNNIYARCNKSYLCSPLKHLTAYTYICFLVTFLLESDVLCAGLGMSVYYFFLTSFFWMNAIAFDVWRSFRVVIRELRITSNKVPWRRFLLYSLYCWAIPALLTVLVKVFDSTNILPEDLRPSFGHQFCWFGQRKALLLFFEVPLIIVMLLNGAFFADVIFVINRATIKSGSAQDVNLRRSFAMFTRLALIMGLTWVFGIAAGFSDNPFLWYIFIVLNTLQGLFIFGVFLGSSKVRSFGTKQNRSRRRSKTSVRTVSAVL
ncbi:G-protein coupled receptor Mth2-like [Parasteatoda tepidariorum]|uniref:G-protein coupled receptor Mth2-like n=1 Tax=Parasteatoda tepidariorum TaxID=114398 RepID=UPI0039BCCDBA